ncbi:hypothetical protein AB751O23_CI_00040 [Chlamydiales bacterium SCGC AB-751-O23]|nr:hypothetical protein AB751O23_CI_00040 [Chlamydiales bacterium SCGC AB-751-O23]
MILASSLRNNIHSMLSSVAQAASYPAYLAGTLGASQKAIAAGKEREDKLEITRMAHIAQASKLKSLGAEVATLKEEVETLKNKQGILEGKQETTGDHVKKMFELTFSGQFIKIGADLLFKAAEYADGITYQPLVITCTISIISHQALKMGRKTPLLGRALALPIALVGNSAVIITAISLTGLAYKGFTDFDVKSWEAVKTGTVAIKFQTDKAQNYFNSFKEKDQERIKLTCKIAALAVSLLVLNQVHRNLYLPRVRLPLLKRKEDLQLN